MLSAAVQRHVALMRACGFVFDDQAERLTDYAAFAEACGDAHVRTETVLDWSRKGASVQRRRTLYLTVRRFALAAVAEDARHQVPPPDLLARAARQRPTPYIYAPNEVAGLVAVADRAASRGCRVPGQYRVLFGLLAATGMRISEALGLDIADVAPDGLLIREAKRRGRRLLPLHPTVETVLEAHLDRRARIPDASEAVFLGDRGGRLSEGTARGTFRRMLALTGLTGAAHGGRNPRIHDLRHTFAVRSLEACAAERGAIGRHMVALSSWLGHVNIVDTYWYLEGTPAVLGRIAASTEAFAAGERP
jgi:integrase